MNYLIIAFILIALLVAAYLFKKRVDRVEAPRSFVALDGEIGKTDMLPRVESNWLHELNEKYEGVKYNKYENKHHAFSQVLCNDIYSSYKYWEKGETHYDFLSKLQDTQKMYFAIINFEGQTNNGGVYQFLFNQPENAIITLEAMRQANLSKLANDYEKVLHQFFGKFDSIEALRNKFQNKFLSWDKRWNSFAEGYEELETAEKIEEYFYDEEYSKTFHDKMAQFVLDHQHELMRFK